MISHAAATAERRATADSVDGGSHDARNASHMACQSGSSLVEMTSVRGISDFGRPFFFAIVLPFMGGAAFIVADMGGYSVEL